MPRFDTGGQVIVQARDEGMITLNTSTVSDFVTSIRFGGKLFNKGGISLVMCTIKKKMFLDKLIYHQI